MVAVVKAHLWRLLPSIIVALLILWPLSALSGASGEVIFNRVWFFICGASGVLWSRQAQ